MQQATLTIFNEKATKTIPARIEVTGTPEAINSLRNFIIKNCPRIPAMAMSVKG